MEHKLFFFLVGCNVPGRFTEQHDVFFGIGLTPADFIPALKNFWTEGEKLHVDCWREVTNVNGYKIKVFLKEALPKNNSKLSLFFINMGGYRKGEFEEFHFKDIFAAVNQAEAVKLAKKSPFFQQYGFKGAVAHIDNKYGIAIDEIYAIEEILSHEDKAKYRILVTNEKTAQDEIHLGYTPLSKLKET
jgi:hypothetical protein